MTRHDYQSLLVRHTKRMAHYQRIGQIQRRLLFGIPCLLLLFCVLVVAYPGVWVVVGVVPVTTAVVRASVWMTSPHPPPE